MTVIYARTSTAGQEQEETIQGQLAACRTYCERIGATVKQCLTDDGISGMTTDRPGLRELRRLSSSGALSRVVMAEYSRLSRDTADFLTLMDELESAGVEVVSATEAQFGRDPFSRFSRTVKAGVNTLEAETIRQRTHSGRIERARRGEYVCGSVPYGYRRDRDSGSPTYRRLVVVESEASVLREMVRLLLAGHNQTGTAEALNAQGLRTRRGNRWTRDSVVSAVTNPAAYGIARLRLWPRQTNGKRKHRDPAEIIDTPDAHEAILSEHDLRRAGLRIGSKQQPVVRRSKSMLGGLLTCGHCGGCCTVGSRDPYRNKPRYHCKGCGRSWYRDDVDAEVWRAVFAEVLVPGVIAELHQAARIAQAAESETVADRVAALRAERASVAAKARRVAEEVAESGGTAALRSLGQQLDERDAALSAQIADAECAASDVIEDLPMDVGQAVDDVRAGADGLDYAGKRLLIHDLVSEVVVTRLGRGRFEVGIKPSPSLYCVLGG